MATITVTISKEPQPPDSTPEPSITYWPSNDAKHGDTVVFLLSGYEADALATISFPDAASSSACFTDPGPFELRPYSLAPPSRTVSPYAFKGLHPFEVSIETGAARAGRHPPADRKNGGIDVNNDPRGELRR